MTYYQAIANAILKIEKNVNTPVRLLCDVKKKWVQVQVKVEGRWVETDKVYDFDNVSHLDVETFILGAIENAEHV
jgi:hypothetical protein